MKLGKRVKNGGSGHTGHIPEQFHDKVQTPVEALYIAVLTRDDIDVLELLKEELNDVWQQPSSGTDHTCCQAAEGSLVLGESGQLNMRLHLAVGESRCSPPGKEVVKTQGRV